MIFNFIVFLLIVLMTLYLANQGLLTALIAMVTATFASLLAMGLTETAEGLVGKLSVEYQRGATFLLIFLLAFSITRITADILVPKNIKLPLLVNRLAAGLVGFFTSMVVMGTIIIGIEMMPLPTSLLGYDRFPGEAGMGDTPGTAGRQSSVWFGPERMTLALWNGASGRALGGNSAFSEVHPDLNVESYGYRHNLQFASSHTLPQDLFEVPSGWMSSDPKDLDKLGIRLEPAKKAVIIRVRVDKGPKPEHSASDSDDYFRITPTQFRLVTDKGHQYFPVGYLFNGKEFTPLTLNTGQVVDDFVKQHVIEDWVFEINDDEKPLMVEMKQTARKDVSAVVKDKPVPALAVEDYPKKPYLKERSNFTVTLTSRVSPITEGKVWVLRQTATHKDMSSEIDSAYDHASEVVKLIDDHKWNSDDKPGVPGMGYFKTVQQTGNTIKNDPPEAVIPWSRALQLILAGQVQSDPAQTMSVMPAYINNTLVPVFEHVAAGSSILAGGTVDANGKLEVRNIPKGNAVIFAIAKTDKGFYVWIKDQNFDPSDKSVPTGFTFDTEQASPKIQP